MFKYVKRLFKKEKKKEQKLTANAAGGNMTAITGAKQQLLTEHKLKNRLSIIDQKIKDLKKSNAPQDKINHWENNRARTKALLWIYFGEEETKGE